MRHGTKAGYQAGCRLECCRRANRLSVTRWKMAKAAGVDLVVPSAPSRRKLEALGALGWSRSELERISGLSVQSMRHAWDRDSLRAETARKIDALYRRLEMEIPPDTRASRTAKTNARKQGWVPPLAWEDIETGVLADQGREGSIRGRLDLDLVEHVLHWNDFSATLSRREKDEVGARWVSSGKTLAHLSSLSGWRFHKKLETS